MRQRILKRSRRVYGRTKTIKADDEEIRKAIERGIITQDYAAELDAQVTYAEFAAMLNAVTTAAAQDYQAAWMSISETFRNVKDPMARAQEK